MGPSNEYDNVVGWMMIRDPKANDVECGSW